MKPSTWRTCFRVAALGAGGFVVLLCFAPLTSGQVILSTDRAVKMHAAASETSSVIAIVPAGKKVFLDLERRRGNYFKVRLNQGRVGWVHGKHLLVADENPDETAVDALTAAATVLRPLCGTARHYRWKAKTVTSGFSQDPTSPSVSAMLHWGALPFHGQDALSWCHVRAGREANAFSVLGFVRRTKIETDGDVHIEITLKADDAVDDCVVVEIPPADLSPKFAKARTDLASLLAVDSLTNKDFDTPKQVRVTGLAFWDGWHLTGSLPNNHGRCNSTKAAAWELHPVFKVAAP